MKKKKRVPVSERAVLDRVNRRLAKNGKVVKICRKGSWTRELGHFYLVCTRTDELLKSHVDLAEYARALGALQSWEFIVNEKGGAA